ncbi:histidinol-phosphate transaminase [Lysinibacter cavernae]|uniref:Histidinol-phosphate aminotransferase n=1 Tax=Lysinibacter cavernae TaxID=1640652 RepID=A0A7X5TV90_9MICO|nr:histidinol-phosphate transaminase [Lysinibacter cavernae]NIH54607.1 histidinol-phosphate aminotransferase [Lysinibacter cavernae]
MTSTNQEPVRLRAEILAKPPYKQGVEPAPGGFKLSSNENPFGPLPSVAKRALGVNDFNRYPDGSLPALRAALAKRYGVPDENVHVSAGSVALLYQLVAAAVGAGDEYIYAWRSFEAYPGLGIVTGASSVQVPNLPDHSHDLEAMLAAITDRTRMMLLCSPNNPTSTTISTVDFEAFMERIPSNLLVVLDEAYGEFVTDEDAVNGSNYLSKYPNLVILHTFSKAYGLAGLRVGYGIGNSRILDAARTAAIPLSVTDSAQQAALASLEPEAEAELLERVSVIAERRDRMVTALRETGWNIPQAQGNFFWLPLGQETVAADRFFNEAGLVVRAFAPEGIRVSVGEEESVATILAVAARILDTLPIDHLARKAASQPETKRSNV